MSDWDDREPDLEPVMYPEDGFWGEPVEGDVWYNAIGGRWDFLDGAWAKAGR